MDSNVAHALIRFGLGRRGAEPLPSDPKSWLMAQVQGDDPNLAVTWTGVAEALQILWDTRRAQFKPGEPTPRTTLRQSSMRAMADGLIMSDTPFRERLVWFWANHFTVAAQGNVALLVRPYLQEAIRPHVTGRFVDMLQAVMRHPAMLMYLNNNGSIGPNSRAGKGGTRGLNENLARECLELHTVSPASGYTQADVTAFAKVLTGWGVQLDRDPRGFRFHPPAHEPGEKIVMGQRVAEGEAGGIAFLNWLGTHPATYRHLAVKLVRHFVADAPPDDAVATVVQSLNASRGDLGAAARALVALPQAWEPPLTKLRPPQEFIVATLRALDLPAERRPDPVLFMHRLGQPLMGAPLPNGWADTGADWASGEALLRRADFAWEISGRAANAVEPVGLTENTLGPLASAETVSAVRRAGSRREALTLLLASPEFQRR